MTTITVDVPRAWLMSANDRKHWRAKAAQTAALRILAREAYKAAGSPRFTTAHIRCHVAYPVARVRDSGNAYLTTKALIDGMTAAGLLPNDDDAHLTGPDMRPLPTDRTLRGVVRFQLTITEGTES